MAAPRFLAAAAACVIRLRFAAESRQSHCCLKVANGALAAHFSLLHGINRGKLVHG